MPKSIVWNDRAKREIRAIEQSTAIRILEGLGDFLKTGQGDVKRLQGIEPPELRLRVGDYRVRFHDHGDALEIRSVRHRRDAYR